MICELLFPSSILAVKLNRKTLVIVLETEIYVYDISNMRLLHVIETVPNPEGSNLCALAFRRCTLPSVSRAATIPLTRRRLHLFQLKILRRRFSHFHLEFKLKREPRRGDGMWRRDAFSTSALAPANVVPAHRSRSLDRKLGKSGTSLGLSRVLPKIFLSALTGENNTISTHMFLRTCRKVSGVDPRTFAEQWIYGSGCPTFGFSASFNRKKMAVEITTRQECPAYKMLEGNEHALALLKPVRIFEGQMTAEHEAVFGAAGSGASGGGGDGDGGYGVWTGGVGEGERNNWKVEDWTEEDETAMSGGDVRVDSHGRRFEWIADLKFEQQDFMWVSQLQRDRDVVAQLEVWSAQCAACSGSSHENCVKYLDKTVLVSNYYFRIRAKPLSLSYTDPNQDLFAHTYVPKPNDFSDLSEYFVRKYADGFYICTIISSAAYATISTASPERGELLPSEVRTEYNEEDADLLKQSLSEVDGYRAMDRLIPSTHNNITIACLERGNYTQVRIAAFDGLFMTKWYTPPIMNYVLAVMAHDPWARKAELEGSRVLLIEEDGSIPDKNKESRKSDMDAMIKALRKDKEVGKNEVFRELMMPLALLLALLTSTMKSDGVCSNWRILIKPIETAPTVKIHIPITPATETPPVLTPLPSKPRPLKLAGPLKVLSFRITSPPNSKYVRLRPAACGHARTECGASSPSSSQVSCVCCAALPPKAKPVPVPKAKPPPPPSKPNGVPAKPVHALKAQASGMSLNDLRGSVGVKEVAGHKHTRRFFCILWPYGTTRPKPMDLQSMAHKLEGGKYADRFAFQADFRLMMANAKLYNPVGSFAHDETLALETYFEKCMHSVFQNTVTSAHAGGDDPKASSKAPRPSSVPQPACSTTHTLTSRPTIKFKAPQPKEAAATAATSKPPKQPKRKPKEVLALEREKASVTNGKRKKVDISEGEDEAEDDLLALATPAKKGRPSPTEPSSSAVPKIVLNTHKSKPPVDHQSPDLCLLMFPEYRPRGRKRKSQRPAALLLVRKISGGTGDADRREEVQAASLHAHEVAGEWDFLRPVIRYFDEIERPMDFGTISANLASHGYETMEQLRKDVDLVFSNCKTFNPPATFPWDCVDAWRSSWVFREPVDPVLQIPTYFNIIKHPRDLHTIRNWLNGDKYGTVEVFETSTTRAVVAAPGARIGLLMHKSVEAQWLVSNVTIAK
ncbi:hypothetical protein B0H14DRAFT_3783570 [Mycena olivaceomarginata]|nr:hypothetical protein B0H14DRAFT_3783570 [Mycena olivaceomarginata]